MAGGLGSSAAAVVAGLLAADFLDGGTGDVLAAATAMEGHPDNVAAALRGGFAICAGGAAITLAPPPELAGVLVVPHEPVATREARAALPDTVPLADAVANVASASLLTLGVARGDLELVARGLDDRLHQPYRAFLYPRSAALRERAAELGALGATISGAGPTVLVWCREAQRAALAERLETESEGWADVLPVAFEIRGAEVSAL
jgi:homoserine kinase